MKEFWKSKSTLLAVILVCDFCLLDLSFCCSLNEEGVALLSIKEKIVGDPHGALSNWVDKVGVETPCSWFGVGCSDGYVVDLNLKDLCLKGTLAPQVGNLVHLKSIILRNNSFSGVIPEEITKLEELEVVDLGYNNFSGQLPRDLGNNFSMTILLLDNNELLVSTHPEIYVLQKLSETQVEEDILSGTNQASSCDSLLMSRNSVSTRNMVRRGLLQLRPTTRTGRRNNPPPLVSPASPTPSPSAYPSPSPSASPFASPSPSPSPTPFSSPSPSPFPSPVPSTSPSPTPTLSPPSNNTSVDNRIFPTALPAPEERPAVNNNNSRNNLRFILLGAIGGPVLLALIVLGVFCYRTGKVVSVKPWATGLSGQLQKAFVTGVPKLKRSELEAACEDFSNVIGSSSVCTFYKGTLSSGTEISVVSTAAASGKECSSNFEALFRKKIDVLSKVNHKNFANLLGYCEEDQPFTRMMVFEYAPNGTLFEHIHIREAEHLDWLMRLRIAMGMAYCLDHMHQLKPPLAHRNLTSSSVHLTEDYAAKISDFVFWDEPNSQTGPSDNVYSFGVILFEMMTGRLPYSAGGGSSSFEDWAADYLSRGESMRDIVDPTLGTYGEDQLVGIGDVIRACVDPNPKRRPAIREVCERLRGITGIGPDGSVPKLSPLWWAEIEIMSNDVN